MSMFNYSDFSQGNQYGTGGYNNLPNRETSMIAQVVSGPEAAINYPVIGSNSTVFLIDFNSGTFWIKSTYDNGIPKQIRTFSFKELIPQNQNNESSNTVSREEFNELKKLLEDLTAPSK